MNDDEAFVKAAGEWFSGALYEMRHNNAGPLTLGVGSEKLMQWFFDAGIRFERTRKAAPAKTPRASKRKSR